MNNFYAASDYKYAEVIKTLEDYRYDTYVKCSIPSVMALLNKNEISNTIDNELGKNLVNKYTDNIRKTSCTISNYILVYIPSLYSMGKGYTIEGQEGLWGHAGDEFVVDFVGGNSDNYVVTTRRY